MVLALFNKKLVFSQFLPFLIKSEKFYNVQIGTANENGINQGFELPEHKRVALVVRGTLDEF